MGALSQFRLGDTASRLLDEAISQMVLAAATSIMCNIMGIPVVVVEEHMVGDSFIAQDGTKLTIVAVDYSDPEPSHHTLTLTDGKEERTYGKHWWAWALQYQSAAVPVK